jgi:hypothetical protein
MLVHWSYRLRVPSYRLFLPTLPAEPVNRQALVNDGKPLIDQRSEVNSPVALEPYVVHPSAPLADEVVMGFERRIVTRAAVTDVDCANLPLCRKALQIPIDSPQTHLW